MLPALGCTPILRIAAQACASFRSFLHKTSPFGLAQSKQAAKAIGEDLSLYSTRTVPSVQVSVR